MEILQFLVVLLAMWTGASPNTTQESSAMRKATACDKTNIMLRLDCGNLAVIRLVPTRSILGRSKCKDNAMQNARCCPHQDDCTYIIRDKKEDHWHALVNTCENSHSCNIQMNATHILNLEAVECKGRNTDYEIVAYNCQKIDEPRVTTTRSSVESSSPLLATETESVGLHDVTDPDDDEDDQIQESDGRGEKGAIRHFLEILLYVAVVSVVILLLVLAATACYLKQTKKKTAASGTDERHFYEEIPNGSSHNGSVMSSGRIPHPKNQSPHGPAAREPHWGIPQPTPIQEINGNKAPAEPVYQTLDDEVVAPASRPEDVVYAEPNVVLGGSEATPSGTAYEIPNQYSEANAECDRYATLVTQTSRDSEYSVPSESCMCGKCEGDPALCPSEITANSPASSFANEHEIMSHTILEENALYSSDNNILPPEGHYSVAT